MCSGDADAFALAGNVAQDLCPFLYGEIMFAENIATGDDSQESPELTQSK